MLKKNKFLVLITLIALCILAAAVYIYWPREPDASLNPDPNHTHSDFAIWVNNEKLDFSANEFMSGLSTDDSTHDEASEYKHEHLHLHDNVGTVIHRHKPGLTLLDFLESLGIQSEQACLLIQGNSYCDAWQMYVNNTEIPFNVEYIFSDLDTILLTFNATSEQVQLQLEQMTDDACLYSQACPWRGDPPVENCIADPEIPCVQHFE